MPARTSLPSWRTPSTRAGIAFRAETSSLVYASRAVRDLLMVLRAVDDPTNYLHIVSALRTPLLACGDDDLFRFKWERRGRWSYLADQPDTVPPDDPVRVGLAYLRSLYEQRTWSAPSELLGSIARDRRALELGFAEGRPRDVWRRLRFVIDQARAWSEATGGQPAPVPALGGRADSRGGPGDRVDPARERRRRRADPDHPRGQGSRVSHHDRLGDVDCPVGAARRRPRWSSRRTGRGRATSSARWSRTEEYVDWAPIDEQMGLHERIRLLYVACTRARDHLVVSVHRKARAKDAGARGAHERRAAPGRHGRRGGGPARRRDGDRCPASGRRGAADASATLRRVGGRANGGASARVSPDDGGRHGPDRQGEPDSEGEPDPGLQKRPRDLDLPPGSRAATGRPSDGPCTACSRPSTWPAGPASTRRWRPSARRRPLPDRVGDVRMLVLQALASPSVVEAAASPHWREIYACTPLEGRLLEGYIDLLYRGPEGLVVVDYKTAATSDSDVLDQRVEGYRTQGASYALTVGASIGRTRRPGDVSLPHAGWRRRAPSRPTSTPPWPTSVGW